MYASNTQKNNIYSAKNQKGIALILSILVLSNLLMITLIVTDIVVRIGRSGHQITQSESAYYAAESATEKAIYEIEKNQDASSLGIESNPVSETMPNNSDVTWQRYIQPINSTPVTCVNNEQKISYHEVSSLNQLLSEVGSQIIAGTISCIYVEDFATNPITKSNDLVVLLQPERSFELAFDVVAPVGIDFYPNKIRVNNWNELPPPYGGGSNNPEGSIIVLSPDGQVSYDTASDNPPINIPSMGNFTNPPDHYLRILNTHSEYVTYHLEPVSAGENIPIAIQINSQGFYKNSQERIIQAQRRNWSIY